MGELLYEWNELAEAWDHLSRGLEHAELGGDVRALIAGYLIMARLKLTEGEVETAAAYPEQARPLVEQVPFADWTSRFERYQFELWLAQVGGAAMQPPRALSIRMLAGGGAERWVGTDQRPTGRTARGAGCASGRWARRGGGAPRRHHAPPAGHRPWAQRRRPRDDQAAGPRRSRQARAGPRLPPGERHRPAVQRRCAYPVERALARRAAH